VFFDNAPVGSVINVSTAKTWGYEHYFGDAAGGYAHSEDWNRFVIAGGAYPTPEPSAVILLMTSGLFGLLAYAWRRRK
jgi:hypothetical protein